MPFDVYPQIFSLKSEVHYKLRNADLTSNGTNKPADAELIGEQGERASRIDQWTGRDTVWRLRWEADVYGEYSASEEQAMERQPFVLRRY